MNANITGENEERVGLYVYDNQDVEHWIEMEFDGGIKYHEQDGYSDDPSKRTQTENEHVNQARRYAKYYVYTERGYDTVDHADNPDYIDAVREAIADLSDDGFEQYFGALYRQLRSHHDGSTPRLVEIPSAAPAPDNIVYELDVYLGVDTGTDAVSDVMQSLSDAHGLDLEDAQRTVTDPSEDALADWRAVGEELLETIDGDVPLAVSAVSGIHVGYPNAVGEHEVAEASDPLAREADTRLELLPGDPGSLSEFRAWVDHHLRCQVRDCLVGMGLHPPEPFQTLGFGKFIYARRYDQYDLYPKYHTADDGVSGLSPW
jgi:hypothetical protein